MCHSVNAFANRGYLLYLQIWMHADQRKSGFLGRPEFYNALRLVTVAQSKRELTPEIVKAALYGPAAAKIPHQRLIYRLYLPLNQLQCLLHLLRR